jgi:phage anti-repressor protein
MITEIVPVETGKLGLMVSSVLLHKKLKSGYRYAHWIKDRIERYQLTEGRDFCKNICKSTGGRRVTDYIVTVGVAMHLALVEESEIGFAIREYFIEIEKQHRDWIGFVFPRLEVERNLFGEITGYNYIKLLMSCGCSVLSGSVRRRIRRNPQEFWQTQSGWIVSEVFGRTIVANAIVRKLNHEATQKRIGYIDRKYL